MLMWYISTTLASPLDYCFTYISQNFVFNKEAPKVETIVSIAPVEKLYEGNKVVSIYALKLKKLY